MLRGPTDGRVNITRSRPCQAVLLYGSSKKQPSKNSSSLFGLLLIAITWAHCRIVVAWIVVLHRIGKSLVGPCVTAAQGEHGAKSFQIHAAVPQKSVMGIQKL